MPVKVSQWYQMSGRIREQHEQCSSTIYFSPGDWGHALSLLQTDRVDADAYERGLAGLEAMRALTSCSNSCLNNMLWKCFGCTPQDDCGRCSCCLSKPHQEVDCTQEVLVILAAVRAGRDQLSFGQITALLSGKLRSKAATAICKKLLPDEDAQHLALDKLNAKFRGHIPGLAQLQDKEITSQDKMQWLIVMLLAQRPDLLTVEPRFLTKLDPHKNKEFTTCWYTLSLGR